MSNKKGFTLWFTGLSGAGKSTLANSLLPELRARGLNVEVLDGDEVRTNLSKGLGFSKEDRDTNIRRIGYVARLLSRNGVGVITAAISPYREVRDEAREAIERDGAAFIEIYVKCSIEALVERDVKGLYKKALAGEIQNFTGVSDPYEEPLSPDVVVETDSETVETSAQKILSAIEQRGLLSSATNNYRAEAFIAVKGPNTEKEYIWRSEAKSV
jgi:adenylyl-sulfate kinase